jgi:hypothetical protein
MVFGRKGAVKPFGDFRTPQMREIPISGKEKTMTFSKLIEMRHDVIFVRPIT